MESKSKKVDQQVEDLIQQIELLDQQINVHRTANHLVEVKQFESLKLGFLEEMDKIIGNAA